MGLIRKSLTNLLGRVVPALIGVGGVALYTRMLDPVSFGTYALLLSVSLVFSAVGFSWLRVAALRLATTSSVQFDLALGATVSLSFVGTAVLVALLEVIALHFLKPNLALSTLLLTIAAAVASGWFDLNGNMLQARLDVVAWGLLNFSRALGALGCSLLLIFAGLKTDALLAGFVVGNCTTLAFIGIWKSLSPKHFDQALFKRLFMFGWPSSVAAACVQISPTFQRYMIDLAAGSGAVGLFAVSQDFTSTTLFVLIGSVSLAGIPMAYKARDGGDPAVLSAQLMKNAALIFAVALPAAVGLAVLAGPIAHNLFGSRFRPGAEVIMAVVAIGTLLLLLRTYYFDQAFELAFETRPQAIISFVHVIVLIVLGLCLIPRFAAVGAVISSVTASACALLLSVFWGRLIVPMPIPLKSWLKTSIAVAGMVLAIELVPGRDELLGLIESVIIGSIVYGVLSLVSRLDLIRSLYFGSFAWIQR